MVSLPIGQALAPYLPAGCCTVIELVSRVLFIGDLIVGTGVLGFEPRLTVLETGILPLDDAPKNHASVVYRKPGMMSSVFLVNPGRRRRIL